MCGHSSVVERLVGNEKVEGSTSLPAPKITVEKNYKNFKKTNERSK